MKKTIFLILLLVICVLLYSQNEINNVTPSETETAGAQNISKTIDKAIIYKIENDLLEKMYTAQFNTINLIITIVLGVFGILGFFGIRSIFTLKTNYEKELSSLKFVKDQFEKDYNSVNSKNRELDEQITKVIEVNEAQNTRLKVLEIKEKAMSLLNQRAFNAAIEYLTIAKDLAPNDVNILSLLGHSQWGAGQYNNSIKTHLQLIELDVDNSVSYATNLMELYLITKQIDEYEKMKNRYLSEIPTERKIIIAYFNIFKQFQLNNTDDFLESIKELISDEQNSDFRQANWRFEEVTSYLNTGTIKDENPNFEIFSTLIKYLMRKVKITVLTELLESKNVGSE